MKIKLLLVVIGAAILALIVSLSIGSLLKSIQPCEQVMVLAVGGCDSNGRCAVIVGNQQGQMKKTRALYPVAGAVECIQGE